MIEPNGTRTIRHPRPWLAGLLSFLAPGVGLVYTGRSKRGLTFYFGFLTLSGIVFASLRFGESLAAYLSVLSIGVVITILRIFAAIDAFIRARATGAIIPGRYQRTWIYIGLIVLDPILYTGVPDRMRGYVFSIPTDAMAPALLAGDQILSNRAPGLSPSPRRGEIVIFRSPSDWRIHYVKRVVGLPGDRVQIRHGILYVNGQPNSQQRISDYVIKTGLNEMRYAQYVEFRAGDWVIFDFAIERRWISRQYSNIRCADQ